MNHCLLIIFSFIFLVVIPPINCEITFKDAIIEPLHHTPNLFPETYDQKGYTKLLDNLIRWEMTRSMYDWKFGQSIHQIKSLSRITNSDYGMAMYYYFEGLRRGLGDPLNAENNFIKALNYFENQKDTSGILHTSMHLFRTSLNTTMLEIGNLSRYHDLYNQVLQIGSKSIEPFDQVVYLRNFILYDEYICGAKHVEFYKVYIEQALSIEKMLISKYDYYKFLIFNTLGIIHSKSRKYTESEYWHEKGYEIISKYPSLELQMATYRLAAMKYETGKYDESLCLLEQTRKYMSQNYRNQTLVKNIEAHAFMRKLYLYNYYQKKDTTFQKIFLEATFDMFINDFFKNRHKLYMQDMAAIHKNEINTSLILEKEKKQARQTLIITVGIIMLSFLIVFTYMRIQKQKKLEKELSQKNFIYSMIGHDLSSPMIGMDMILDQIYTDLQYVLNDKQKIYLNQLRSNAQGGNLLLNNLLNLYKQETGFSTNHHNYTPIQIKNEINIAISHLFNNKIGTFITIENRCPEHIVQPIDSPSFQCVIRNIVDNALKHSQCDTIILNAELNQNNLIVTITNNGIELPKGILEIFNQDKSILESSLSKTKIGLGTIFIMEFVHALKSKLKVHTNENETKFIWTIPIH
jgi:signal transduction histidine kinase